jgi:hypothetical protein
MTFRINSLAHTVGHQTFSKCHTSFDSVITALATLGEGYHNYHHEFPHDYRYGIRWYHYDPTKWAIRSLSFFNLCTHLVCFPDNEIEKAKVQCQQQEIDAIKSTIDWGKPIKGLPLRACLLCNGMQLMPAARPARCLLWSRVLYTRWMSSFRTILAVPRSSSSELAVMLQMP